MSGETRKLQKVGGGTYTVSIPKEWATEHSLSAGETVHLYPDGDGSLVVCRNGAADEAATATITVGISEEGADGDDDGATATDNDGAADDGDDDHLDRTLRAAYAAGVDRVTLTAPDGFTGDRRRRIDRLVRERTGTRIAAESEESVTIKTILDDGEVSIQRTVVQLQFVTLSLFRTAMDLAVDPGANGADRVADRRGEARRLSSLVTRQFGRSLSRPSTAVDLGVDRASAFDCYRTAQALDRLATLSTDIAAASDGVTDADLTETLRSIAERVRLYAEEATTAVVDGCTVDAARELRETRDEIDALAAEFDESGGGDAKPLLDPLLEAAACGDRIADVALEAAIRRDE